MAKVALPDWLKPQALINGGWVPAYDGSCFDVVNPATQQVIAKVAECGAGETAAAIDASLRAVPMIVAPCAWSVRAISRPMPRDAPVIRTRAADRSIRRR